jgi:hypothetical protein
MPVSSWTIWRSGLWFAAVVLLVTIVYRKLMGSGAAAGLAALLFLLDANTYGPVMFVANRGFLLSLCFGLLCLYEHHQWRGAGSRAGCVLSMLFLALALLANEGGASTLAFLLAYALRDWNTAFGGLPKCRKGDRCDLGNLTVEVLETDPADLPQRVAFRFKTSLDSPDLRWLWFQWEEGAYADFKVPAVGESVTLPGPYTVRDSKCAVSPPENVPLGEAHVDPPSRFRAARTAGI